MCACVGMFLQIWQYEDSREFLTNEVRTFMGSENVLAGPQLSVVCVCVCGTKSCRYFYKHNLHAPNIMIH